MAYTASKGVWFLTAQLTTEYSPIRACMACNGIMVDGLPTTAIVLCSDTDNPLTERTIPAGGWFGITPSFAGAGNSRWSPNEVMFYAKVAEGTGSLVVTYIK